MSWRIDPSSVLPEGWRVSRVACATDELAHARLAAAAKILGSVAACERARSLGAYELDEARARELRLEGVALGEGGEIPALSPARWVSLPEAEGWEELRARLHREDLELAGLRLEKSAVTALEKFLASTGVTGTVSAEKAAAVARHLFTSPFEVVIRPRA